MSQKNGEHRHCEICNGSFYISGSRAKDRTRGRFCSRSCKYKSYRGVRRSLGSEFKKGEHIAEQHWLWKGDRVGYHALHRWIGNHWEKTNCTDCGATQKLEWANIDGEYTRDKIHWRVLCKHCHRKLDAKSPKIPGSRFTYAEL